MLLLRCLRKVAGVVTVFNSITLVLKYAREISEKSLEQKSVTKVVQNSDLKLFWNSKHNCSEVERATSSNFRDKTNFSVAYSYLTAKAV